MIDIKEIMSPKIVLWDLETTNLNANYGYLLAFGYKYLGEKKPTVYTIAQSSTFKKSAINDRELVKAAASVLSEADLWVTWYGKRFDVPYLNSRLLKHAVGYLPPVPHIDGWEIARKKLKLNSNRLQSVSEFLGLSSKTPVLGDQWIAATAGNKKGIKYVADHCARDVDILEQAYLNLRPLLIDHPYLTKLYKQYGNVKTPDNCRTCGVASSYNKAGNIVTLTRVYQRFKCKECGSWTKEVKQEK